MLPQGQPGQCGYSEYDGQRPAHLCCKAHSSVDKQERGNLAKGLHGLRQNHSHSSRIQILHTLGPREGSAWTCQHARPGLFTKLLVNTLTKDL